MKPTVKFFLILLLTHFSIELFAQEGLYLLNEQGNELFYLNSSGQQAQWNLPVPVFALKPTPGGAYLFLLNKEGRILGLNVQTGEIDRDQQLDLQDLQGISFFPTGHQIIIQSQEETWLAHHSRGNLTAFEEIPHIDGGSVQFNRRGTRYYFGQNNTLKYQLFENHRVLKEIPRAGEVEDWLPGPRFRLLWGVDRQGTLHVVDEQRARVIKNVRGPFASESLVFHGDDLLLLSKDGLEIYQIESRRFSKQSIVELDRPAFRLHDGGDAWFLVLKNPSEIRVFPRGLQEDTHSISLDFIPGESAWLTLRQGEGFACF